MKVLETEKLILRWLTVEDAPFILQLLNEPSWIRFIGDKGIRTLEDARNYIVDGPIDMYARLGFGLYLVDLKESQTPIGLCGLIKRVTLVDIDIGFAFLSEYQSKGYGYEAAAATLEYGKEQLGLKRIVAITTQDNQPSGKLLEKIGMKFEGLVRLSDEELKLFAVDFS
ncbi:GNAT family N-acetyltransferase [Pseudoneobacillus sp. C159]